MFRNFLLTMLIILPMAAHAHSPLSSSFPSDGETLDVPPVEIVMDFKASAKLIKVELMMSKDKEGNGFLGGLFGGDDGEPVPLGKSFLMSMNKRQIIPMPSQDIHQLKVLTLTQHQQLSTNGLSQEYRKDV